ncbi:MAG: tetratricopeptide repeat protein [Armatimonadetes bacterium]|nr:tetratricopeptide repeat protein [Armatimonadota bacterium]
MISDIEALMEQGKWDEAETALVSFTFNHPENPQGHAYLGLCYERNHLFERAADQFQRAVALEPHYWEAGRKLFQCLDKLGRAREALNVARDVHNLRPSDKMIEQAIERLENELGESKIGVPPKVWRP